MKLLLNLFGMSPSCSVDCNLKILHREDHETTKIFLGGTSRCDEFVSLPTSSHSPPKTLKMEGDVTLCLRTMMLTSVNCELFLSPEARRLVTSGTSLFFAISQKT